MKRMLFVLALLCLLPWALAETPEVDAELPTEADIGLVPQADVPALEVLPVLDDSLLVIPPAEDLLEEPLEFAEERCAIDAEGDSAALFAAYANGVLRGGTARRNATDNTRARLSGQDLLLYDRLKPDIARVAEGERCSTVFQAPVLELLGATHFTATELGVQMPYPRTPEATARLAEAFRARYTYTLDTVAYALWYDCTYELYWLDRYDAPIRAARPSAYLRYDLEAGDYVVYVNDDACVTFRFPVLEAYAGEDIYTLDTGRIDAAHRARDNARAIVRRYGDCSDYVRLYAYAVEICAMTDYDHTAEDPEWQAEHPQLQDPWKLIWVFDGDEDTNVVCEGFAQAYQYLCELTDFSGDIRCSLVTGRVGGGDHSWNLVRMDDGRNYAVDVTWMDGTWDDLDGGLAEWIGEGVGDLFLCGGSGSVSGGYTLVNRRGEYGRAHAYRKDTLQLYARSALTLAKACRLPAGKQVIHGVSYFYEDDGSLHTRHAAVRDAAVPATCTEPGRTAGSHCAVCGAVLTPQKKVPALGHRWGKPRYVWADDYGSVTATRTCRRDAGHVQAETARTTAAVAKPAGCTAMGKTAYTARFENSAFSPRKKVVRNIPALGHAPFLDAAVAPRGAIPGRTQGSHCAVCGRVLVAQRPVTQLDCLFPLKGNARHALMAGMGLQLSLEGCRVRQYRTSDRRVATVTRRGWVLARRPGEVTVTAELAGSGRRTLKLTVLDPYVPESVKLKGAEGATLKVGQRLTLSPALNPVNAKTALTFSSSDPKMASVSAGGVVRGKKPGTVTITVTTDNGRQDAVTLTVSR